MELVQRSNEVRILRVGVVGARVRNAPEDKQLVKDALLHLMQKHEDVRLHLVSGGCPKGADRFAEELSQELSLSLSIHYPDESQMKDNSRSEYARICYARNTLIANECDMLIALPAYDHIGPIGGTADTMKKVDKQGKPVVSL